MCKCVCVSVCTRTTTGGVSFKDGVMTLMAYFLWICVCTSVCVCLCACVCVCVCTGAITCDFFLIGFVMTLKAYVLCIYMLGYILCMFANA
jgi:hypothetical protein